MRRTVLTLLVCAVPFVAQAADGGAKAGIEAGNRKFEEAVARGDAAAIAKLYAEDAEILPMGNLALEVGSWKLEDASGKGPEGKYMVLWKKNGSTWQLYRDMWSENAPPPPPAPAATAQPAPAA